MSRWSGWRETACGGRHALLIDSKLEGFPLEVAIISNCVDGELVHSSSQRDCGIEPRAELFFDLFTVYPKLHFANWLKGIGSSGDPHRGVQCAATCRGTNMDSLASLWIGARAVSSGRSRIDQFLDKATGGVVQNYIGLAITIEIPNQHN
jgi:hypothetical protein